MNIFEKAARLKIRFSSGQGMISVEDLFDLPLTSTVRGKANLDDIGKVILRALKTTEEESLVNPSAPADDMLKLQLEIVKHVIKVKQDANAERLLAKEKAEKKQRILALLADKENEEMAGKSKEELLKELEELS